MKKIADRTVELDKGHVDIYTENGVTLYAYQTRDLIDNEMFILAKNGRGLVIELPCFYDNIRELTAFLAQEHNTVEGKLVAYHAAGASFLPGVPAYGTASSVAYNTTGGGAGLVANFKAAPLTQSSALRTIFWRRARPGSRASALWSGPTRRPMTWRSRRSTACTRT